MIAQYFLRSFDNLWTSSMHCSDPWNIVKVKETLMADDLVRIAGIQTALMNGLLGLDEIVSATRVSPGKAIMTTRMRRQFEELEADITAPYFVSDRNLHKYERGVEEAFQLLRRILLETFPDGEPLGECYIDRLVWRIGLKRLKRSEVSQLKPGAQITHISGNGAHRIETSAVVTSVTTSAVTAAVDECVYAGAAVSVEPGSVLTFDHNSIYARQYYYILATKIADEAIC